MKISHSLSKFEFGIRVGNISHECKSSSINRWVHRQCSYHTDWAKLQYRARPVVRIKINIWIGDIAMCTDIQRGYEHKLSFNLSPTHATQHIYYGKYCHIRAHPGFCLEKLKAVSQPGRCGSFHPCPSTWTGWWNLWPCIMGSWVLRRINQSNLRKYNKYKFRDDGEDVATRQLCWGKN